MIHYQNVQVVVEHLFFVFLFYSTRPFFFAMNLINEFKKLLLAGQNIKEVLEPTTQNYHTFRKRIGVNHKGIDPNHVPDEFFSRHNLSHFVFLGMYGGDGLSRRTHNVVGFSLRSTEFAFLYEFLVHCGAKRPRFSFYANTSQDPQLFKAGYHASVKWEYLSNVMDILRDLFGFPSSLLYDSDDDKLDDFLNGINDEERLLLFFLGWFMADGTILWRWNGDTQHRRIKYTCAQISSRDGSILSWFQKRLKSIGTTIYKDSRGQSVLKVVRSEENRRQLLHAMSLMHRENIPMNGKLICWEWFMKSKDNMLAEGTAPPRSKSFFEYLGQEVVANHPLACLIGQDLYASNKYQLNIVLNFGGYPTVNSTYQLDILDLTNYSLRLLHQEIGSLSRQQLVFVEYIKCCQKRLNNKLTMTDHRYITVCFNGYLFLQCIDFKFRDILIASFVKRYLYEQLI